MNKYIAMGAGALIGGGIGYVIAHILVERFMTKPEEQAEQEESNNDFVSPDESEEAALTDDEEPASHRIMLRKHSPEIDYTKYANIDPKPDLIKLAAKYNKGVVEGDVPETHNIFEDARIEKENPKPVDPNEPHVVTVDEYLENPNNYTYTALLYHGPDDILCTEKGLPLREPEKLLGDSLNKFEGMTVVYVANPRLKALYEVDYIDEPFLAKERDVRTKTRRVTNFEDEEPEE
jgi:hypothetical protein